MKETQYKCPRCGQSVAPIGKHNKCTICSFQLDCVTYDKERSFEDGPSGSMPMKEFTGI